MVQALKSVSLENGGENPFDQPDYVAVVATWQWPDMMADVTVSDLRRVQTAVAAGRYRENAQAKDWVGNAVAQVMKLDITNRAHKAKVGSLIKVWLSTGMLVTVEGEDEKRMKRTFRRGRCASIGLGDKTQTLRLGVGSRISRSSHNRRILRRMAWAHCLLSCDPVIAPTGYLNTQKCDRGRAWYAAPLRDFD